MAPHQSPSPPQQRLPVRKQTWRNQPGGQTNKQARPEAEAGSVQKIELGTRPKRTRSQRWFNKMQFGMTVLSQMWPVLPKTATDSPHERWEPGEDFRFHTRRHRKRNNRPDNTRTTPGGDKRAGPCSYKRAGAWPSCLALSALSLSSSLLFPWRLLCA
jgi:hypothetical protein